jgi:hypothetical protein
MEDKGKKGGFKVGENAEIQAKRLKNNFKKVKKENQQKKEKEEEEQEEKWMKTRKIYKTRERNGRERKQVKQENSQGINFHEIWRLMCLLYS